MIETIKVSGEGNFRLCKRDGIGMNNTPFEELFVRSEGLADKYVVEIRLDSDYKPFNGQPIKQTYTNVYIAHGMRSVNESLAETSEYVDVLKEAIDFAYEVKNFIESSEEWSK